MLDLMAAGLKRLLAVMLSVCLLLSIEQVAAHGGVAFEDDLCVININFMQAHFTVFQPQVSQTKEFCENIPEVTTSVFVMEYLHELLTEMSIDFRIIRDVNEVGRFASWKDIEAIDDLDAATVYYRQPVIEEGGFYRASHTFEEKGTYIGVVTAEHPVEDRSYNAVFYFQVGGRDLGTLPFYVLLALMLQLGYWLSSGGWNRIQKRLLA
ncbi:MAG: hypothetical protein OXE78_13455 [Gammaproteobacteria bacterium]|nr:hypothetical protein [Gammaproteobacteria bacterium]MCY4357121.1 hypothetical protein [Gammaproteobacteria bacterium]